MKIGIIRTSSIGDAVLATACLDYLRQVSPQAHVVWVGRNPSLSLIQASWPNVKAMELLSNGSGEAKRRVIDELRRCDAVIDLQTNHRSRQMMRQVRKSGVPAFSANKQAKARVLLIILSWFRGRIFRVKAQARKPSKFQYEMMLDALHSALSALGVSDISKLKAARPMLCSPTSSMSDASWVREMDFGKWLGVAPGASYPTKMAPTEIFKDTLTELQRIWPRDESLPGLVFLGGKEDRAAAVELMDDAHWPGPVINLAGKITLDETARALAKTQVLLSNDSGLAHIAEALGRPVAVVFGPTTESFGFSPQRIDSASFSSDLGCRPCSKHGKQPCRYGDKLCFKTIDTRSIARHLQRHFTSGGVM